MVLSFDHVSAALRRIPESDLAVPNLIQSHSIQRDIFALTSKPSTVTSEDGTATTAVFVPPTSDIMLGIWSLLCGSPILQVFFLADEKFGISKIYWANPFDTSSPFSFAVSVFGWAASHFAYLLLWDLVFYIGHLALHHPTVYHLSHHAHHAFRPPTAWSGIAIDFIETFLSGIFPFLFPLFIAPFHAPTVYVLNILLVLWATLLHSSATSLWTSSSTYGLFISPADHNLHHARGEKGNRNFGAIFTIWDRWLLPVLGKLVGQEWKATWDGETLAPWIRDEREGRVHDEKDD